MTKIRGSCGSHKTGGIGKSGTGAAGGIGDGNEFTPGHKIAPVPDFPQIRLPVDDPTIERDTSS